MHNREMSITNIQVVNAAKLTKEHVQAWARIQESEPSLDSSFFRPEFTQMVAEVRDDVEVAILSEGEQVVGFFPFQRTWRNLAQPVSGRLSELHGVIAPGHVAWSADSLTRACGIASWRFDHLLASQSPFHDFTWSMCPSPYMNLDQGYEHYIQEKQKTSSSAVKQVLRKTRKLEREVGPLRFLFHTDDDSALEALLKWKAAQCKQTKRLNLLRYRWVTDLLDRTRTTQTDSFGGALSVLYARDELVAVHLGLRSRSALHIWFPAFNRDYEKYSPGLILLLNLAQAVAARAMRRIDFGRGPERYKQDFKTGDMVLAEGAVDHHVARRLLRKSWHHAKRWMRATPFRPQFEASLRWSYRVREWLVVR